MTRSALMREACIEAERARGRTWPNPIVGALIVRDGQTIARGHHERAGQPHAEVMALREAGDRARGAELYVTLEPCNHTGRTPPCTEAILAAGIARVFVGARDPNRGVRGGGLQKLRDAGVEIVAGVEGELCRAQLEPWFRFLETGRPWVLLKAAATLDGKLATRGGDSRWVTGESARLRVHAIRDQLDAILVGTGTVLMDDPRLDVRLPAGTGLPPLFGKPEQWALERLPAREPRPPLRVVLDSQLRTPASARLLAQPGRALILTSASAPEEKRRALEAAGAELEVCASGREGKIDLHDALARLGKRGLTSLLVEGGAQIHGSFLREGLWDELALFLAPKLAGADGISWAGFTGLEAMNGALGLSDMRVDASSCTPDLLVRARPVS